MIWSIWLILVLTSVLLILQGLFILMNPAAKYLALANIKGFWWILFWTKSLVTLVGC